MTFPLFDAENLPEPPSPAQAAQSKNTGKPRLRVPIRNQIEMQWVSLDELLEPDHPVRAIWAAVCSFDLSSWLNEIKAVERHVGRDATDPRLLASLWIYATLKGIGSARELDRLCREHISYKWLCGGVSVNYHMLADFRSQGGEKWDSLLTHMVGTLMHEGLVKMDRIAQDGMKVRANAGKSSFRRQSTLEECLEEARQQVETLKQLAEEDADELTRRQRAARERAARERQERIEAAIDHCEELRQEREASAKKSGRKVKEPRASTTDPEMNMMKFADGGFWPGVNVQFATDTASKLIGGVEVSDAPTDNEELTPMIDQCKERYDRVPNEALADGGFATVNAIEQATERGCTVYAPLKDEEKQRAEGKDPNARKKGDSDAVADWRSRMGTDAAKLIYKLRCQTAEWVNAQCRNRGLWHMPVRGLVRCRNVALIYAIAHNVVVAGRLRQRLRPARFKIESAEKGEYRKTFSR